MKLGELMDRIAPFPVRLPGGLDGLEVGSPADLSDPDWAQAICQAVAEDARGQGANERWAWAYGTLVASVVTGWAVDPGVDVEAGVLDKAYSLAINPAGNETIRLYLAPGWTELEIYLHAEP